MHFTVCVINFERFKLTQSLGLSGKNSPNCIISQILMNLVELKERKIWKKNDVCIMSTFLLVTKNAVPQYGKKCMGRIGLTPCPP